MRNRLRVAAFDVLAPVAVLAALLYIGVALRWPLWWVSVCSVLCLLVVQAVVVDFAVWGPRGDRHATALTNATWSQVAEVE